MAHSGKNKGSGSQGDSVNAVWFTKAVAARRKKAKAAKQARKKNRK